MMLRNCSVAIKGGRSFPKASITANGESPNAKVTVLAPRHDGNGLRWRQVTALTEASIDADAKGNLHIKGNYPVAGKTYPVELVAVPGPEGCKDCL